MTDVCFLADSCLRTGHEDRPTVGRHLKTVKLRQGVLSALSDKQAIQAPDQTDDSDKEKWGKITNDLVQVSTLPFLVLCIPQVIHNAVNLSKGNLAALKILSWKGFLTALAGNSILLSYFLKKDERGASIVQAIGVISNFILLIQIWMAGLLEGRIVAGAALFILTSCLVNCTIVLATSRSLRFLDVDSLQRFWETLLSAMGLSLFVQAMYSTVFPDATLLPAFVTAIATLVLGILEWMSLLGRSAKNLWSGLSAWTATFLFAFQPIGQLVCNFADPSSLAGLSLNMILLAMIGNGMMVPRALHTRDKIWLTGTLWSSLMMGWVQLLCLYLGGMATGSHYLSGLLFYFLSLCAGIYFYFVFSTEAKISQSRNFLTPLIRTYLK